MTSSWNPLFQALLLLALLLVSQAETHNNQEVILVGSLTSAHASNTSVSGAMGSGAVAYTTQGLAVGTSDGVYLINQGRASQVFSTSMLFVGDLSTKSMLAFLDHHGSPLTGPGFLVSLALINPSTGLQTGTIPLSEPVFVGLSTGVFAGAGRILLSSGSDQEMLAISTTTGAVSTLTSALDQWIAPDGWVAIGAAEFTFSEDYVLYGDLQGTVSQQELAADRSTEVVSSALPALSSIAIDLSGQWAAYSSGQVRTADASLIRAWPTSQPSSQPSRQPVGQPTSQPTRQPTSKPSLGADAPKVVSISYMNTSTTISLLVRLDVNVQYAGTLYCAALTKGTVVTSVNQVITAGTSVSYTSASRDVAVTISALVPVTDYDAYCYAITKQGYTNSLADVQATKKGVSTQCCKTISYLTNPSSVYSDLSKYTSSQISEYTFSYVLLYPPKKNVTVTPRLLNAKGQTVKAVTISPTATTFTSASSTLRGTFILQAAKNFTNTFSVRLLLSGSSYAEFTTSNISTTMLSSVSPPASPLLRFSYFSNTGASLFIVFDSSTDLAGKSLGSAYDCSNVFEFLSAAGSSCLWLNGTHIEATLKTGVAESMLPAVGSAFKLLPRTVKAACQADTNCTAYAFTKAQNVTIAAPLVSLVPTVVLTAPSSLGFCDDLSILATMSSGNAGRNWTAVTWAVSAQPTANTTAVLAVLNSYGKTTAKKILIPRSMLVTAKYSFTLTLTNFFGASSSTTAVVDVSADTGIPVLSILGSTTYTMLAKQVLTIYSRAQFSSCSNATDTIMVYGWSVRNSRGAVAVTSNSIDPSIFSLPAFALTAGDVYTVTVNGSVVRPGKPSSSATTSAIVNVQSGKVVASIAGGDLRQVSADRNITLDASGSYDEDSTKAVLKYLWTCSYLNVDKYGKTCNNLIMAKDQRAAIVTVIGSRLNSSDSYLFTSTVSSGNRSAIVSATVNQVVVGAPYIELLISTSQKFNADQNLSLSGLIQSDLAADTLWEVLIAGVFVNVTAYTAKQQNYPRRVVANTAVVSILLAANSFTAGSYVTFRLTAVSYVDMSTLAHRHGMIGSELTKLTTYTEITMIANTPPQGGSLAITPGNGTALSTKFSLESNGWYDDPEDYPLTYSFQYLVSPTSVLLTIQAVSPLNSVFSDFPAGLQSYDYQITITTRSYDTLGAFNSASKVITVASNKNIDVSGYLSNGLTNALNSGDTNAAFQTVNNVASTINEINCSIASTSFCSSLDRLPCSTIPNTCEGCKVGFKGISGPANTKCFNASADDGAVGSSCLVNADCLFGNCELGFCALPVQSCPTDTDAVCSGHGQCKYRDVSGNALNASSCLITNIYCKAACVCDEGYSGSSCFLDPAHRLSRDADRALLCDAINSINGVTNPSAQLLENLAGTLLSSYNPAEVFSENTTVKCQAALNTITTLTAEGYISGAASGTAGYLVSSVSSYVEPSTNDTSTSNLVSDAIGNVTTGLLSSMTNGQDAISLVSGNIQVSFVRSFVTDLYNASLIPPLSDAEKAYGVEPLTVDFGPTSIEACANSEDYVPLSIMKWGSNPFPNSSDALSPMLRMSQSADASTTSAATAVRLKAVRAGHRNINSDLHYEAMATAASRRSVMQSVPTSRRLQDEEEVGYFITLPFASPQDFNFSLTPEEAARVPGNNFTFPDCSYNIDNVYQKCVGCNISTYTNYNVTYKCVDMSQICGGVSASAANAWGLQEISLMEDDATSTGSTMQVAQYAALFNAIKGVLLSTLSSNPFAINIEEAKVIISFVLSLVVIIVSGSLYFYQWDLQDRYQLIYARRWPPKSLFNRKKEKHGQGAGKYNKLFSMMEPAVPETVAQPPPTKMETEEGTGSEKMPRNVSFKEPPSEPPMAPSRNLRVQIPAYVPVDQGRNPAVSPMSSTPPALHAVQPPTPPSVPASEPIVSPRSSTRASIMLMPAPLEELLHDEPVVEDPLSPSTPLSQRRLEKDSDDESESEPTAMDTFAEQVPVVQPEAMPVPVPAPAPVAVALSAVPEPAPISTEAAPSTLHSEPVPMPVVSTSERNVTFRADSESKLTVTRAPLVSTPSKTKSTQSISRSPSKSPVKEPMLANYGMKDFLSYSTTTFYDLAVPDVLSNSQDKEKTADSKSTMYNRYSAMYSNTVQTNMFYIFMKILLARHDFTSVFTTPSVSFTRLIRYIGLCKSILIGFFIDTIFFSVFFANTGACELFTDAYACTLGINSITGEPTCLWTQNAGTVFENTISNTDGECALAPPPSDLMFVMMLALICMIVGVPLDMLFGFILEEYAAKRPDLKQLGWNTEYWIGRGTKMDDYALKERKAVQEQGKQQTEQQYLAGILANKKLSQLYKELTIAEHSWPRHVQQVILENHGANALNSVLFQYQRFQTVEEELKYINTIIAVYNFHYQRLNAARGDEGGMVDVYRSRCEILKKALHIHINGKMRNLKLMDYCWYRSNEQKLFRKLAAIHKQEDVITETLEDADCYDEEVKEVILLQYFILEQFGAFHRYILKNQLFAFDNYSPEVIDGYMWLAAWVFVVGSMLFYVYWILAWGVASGNALLTAWGMNFAVGAIQDIFFVQVFKIMAIYIIAIISIRPQLLRMRLLLQSATLQYITGNFPQRKLTPYLDGQGAASLLLPVHNENVNNLNLFSIPLIQVLSPVCRVANGKEYSLLGITKILKNIDDMDVLTINQQVTGFPINWSTLWMAFIPFLLFFLLGDSAGELAIDFLLPTFSSFFILANQLVFEYSITLLVCLYIAIMVYFIWKRKMLQRVFQSMQRRWTAAPPPVQVKLHSDDKDKDLPHDADVLQDLLVIKSPVRAATSMSKPKAFWAMLLLEVGKAVLFFMALLNSLLHGIHNVLFLREPASWKAKREEHLLPWQQMNIPGNLQGREHGTEPEGEMTASRDDGDHQHRDYPLPNEVLAMRKYHVLDNSTLSMQEAKGRKFIQRYDQDKLLQEMAIYAKTESSMQQAWQTAILRPYTDVLMQKYILHAPCLLDAQALNQPASKPSAPQMVQGEVVFRSNVAKAFTSTHWSPQFLARSITVEVVKCYLLKLEENKVRATSINARAIAAQQQVQEQVREERQESQEDSKNSSREQAAQPVVVEEEDDDRPNYLNLDGVVIVDDYVTEMMIMADKMAAAEEEMSSPRPSSMALNQRPSSMALLGMDKPPSPSAAASLPVAGIVGRRSTMYTDPVPVPVPPMPVLSKQMTVMMKFDISNPATLLKTAENIVDNDMDLPMVISDLTCVLREVLRTFPIYKQLKNLTEEEQSGKQMSPRGSAAFSMEESDELIQDFNIFAHGYRKDKQENSLPFQMVSKYLLQLVLDVINLHGRGEERVATKVKAQLRKKNKRSGDEEEGSEEEEEEEEKEEEKEEEDKGKEERKSMFRGIFSSSGKGGSIADAEDAAAEEEAEEEKAQEEEQEHKVDEDEEEDDAFGLGLYI